MSVRRNGASDKIIIFYYYKLYAEQNRQKKNINISFTYIIPMMKFTSHLLHEKKLKTEKIMKKKTIKTSNKKGNFTGEEKIFLHLRLVVFFAALYLEFKTRDFYVQCLFILLCYGFNFYILSYLLGRRLWSADLRLKVQLGKCRG